MSHQSRVVINSGKSSSSLWTLKGMGGRSEPFPVLQPRSLVMVYKYTRCVTARQI